MEKNAAGLSMLIVEDNEISRNLLRDLLQLEGHNVSVAENGTHGLRILETQQFDAALIDIGLPDMSGFEVARSVRGHVGGEEILLVALTGHGRAEDRRAVREAGFDEHLVKPLDLDRLRRILSELR